MQLTFYNEGRASRNPIMLLSKGVFLTGVLFFFSMGLFANTPLDLDLDLTADASYEFEEDATTTISECDGIELTLTINLDNFAGETSWELSGEGGVIASDAYGEDGDDGATVVETICVPEGCYTFTMFDSFGDGICCTFGEGSYSLEDEFGNTLAEGGEFGLEDATNFCASIPGPCEGNELVLYLTTDNFGGETSWELEAEGGGIIASGDNYASNTPHEIPICVPDGCYYFRVLDSFGDGICCTFGNGSYSLEDSEGNVLAANAAFTGAVDETYFCVEGEPSCDPGPLPPPWSSADIGGATGGASYNECEDAFCVYSNGISFPTSDKVHYAYKYMCGNGEIVARVASVNNGGLGGIMFRESLAQGSKKVAMRTHLNGAHFVQRDIRTYTNSFSSSQQIFRPGHDWLKIVRTGNQFIGYTSTNGSYWQFAFFANVSMSYCIYVGLYAEGPIDNVTTTACFDNVYCSGGNEPVLVDGFDNNTADQVRANGFSVFPNPASDVINVNLQDFVGKAADLTLYNSLGQAIKQLSIDEVQNPTERIQLNGLNTGTYLIEVRTDTQTKTKKFIISN